MLVLDQGQGPDVPANVVAPPVSLGPVDAPRVDPDQVAWLLQEPVDWNVLVIEVFDQRPPGAVAKVNPVLVAEFLERFGVFVGHAEPLAVAGPHVDVDGAEAADFLEVELVYLVIVKYL